MTREPSHFKPEAPPPRVDLHCHSTCSDGTVSPAALVARAAELGIRALALTDHDTLCGLAEFLGAPAPADMLRLPGVEISCWDAGRRLHVVGLGVRTDHPPLLDLLAQVRGWRRERNREMISRLAGLGVPVASVGLEQLAEETDVLGRPHLAAKLVEMGACRTVREAFAKYLGHGRPAFVSRRVCPFDEAIPAIHGAGGIAIWAHPLTSSALTVAKFARFAADYAARGLDGIEAYYPEFSPHQVGVVERVAADTGLLLSGGSDFHGSHIPDIALGTGYGSLHVPERVLPPLLACIERRQASL